MIQNSCYHLASPESPGHRPFALTSIRAMPIYDNRVRRYSVNFSILRSEALPKRGDHLREPEHVQPEQGGVSTSVPGDDGTREPIPRLEYRLEKLVRNDRAVAETRTGECGNQNQSIDKL